MGFCNILCQINSPKASTKTWNGNVLAPWVASCKDTHRRKLLQRQNSSIEVAKAGYYLRHPMIELHQNFCMMKGYQYPVTPSLAFLSLSDILPTQASYSANSHAYRHPGQ